MLKQQASLAKMRREIAERERLKAQIDKLMHMHFVRKSEQLDQQINQFGTQLEDLAAGSGVADVRRAR